MNSSMTRTTQNSQIGNIIILMAWIYMMNLQNSIRLFTDKALIYVIRKCEFSVIATSFSIVFILFARTFKSVKNLLFTFVRTKFRTIFSTIFSFINCTTQFTRFKYLIINILRKINIAFSTAITNFTTLTFRYVARSFKEGIITIFTYNFDFIIPSSFVTRSRTINGAKFNNFSSTDWTYLFHMPSLSLATVNVNNKQEVSNAREIPTQQGP